jgi:hypothetical protein
MAGGVSVTWYKSKKGAFLGCHKLTRYTSVGNLIYARQKRAAFPAQIFELIHKVQETRTIANFTQIG